MLRISKKAYARIADLAIEAAGLVLIVIAAFLVGFFYGYAS